RGQQIAFDPVRDEIERVAVRFLALCLEPAREPLGQRLARDRSRLDQDAGALERLEPRALLRSPVDGGKLDQRDRVLRRSLAIGLERSGAVDAGLAARNPELEDAARGEQRLGTAAERKLAPLEAGFGGEDLALAVAFRAGLGADTVAGLDG